MRRVVSRLSLSLSGSSYCVVNDKDDDGTNDGDKHAVEVEASYSGFAKKLE